MKKVNLIYATSINGIIGYKGKIPWHLPEDLESFKEKTLGQTVIMGRKTWESLPASMKPLPGRSNIVVSRGGPEVAPGAIVVNSLSHAIASAESPVVWVIGGEKLLEDAMLYADEIHVTEVLITVNGDTHAPKIDSAQFQLISVSSTLKHQESDISFGFNVYKRK